MTIGHFMILYNKTSKVHIYFMTFYDFMIEWGGGCIAFCIERNRIVKTLKTFRRSQKSSTELS